jgi:hypothetical protein
MYGNRGKFLAALILKRKQNNSVTRRVIKKKSKNVWKYKKKKAWQVYQDFGQVSGFWTKQMLKNFV